jgi:hypothetical protein
MSWTHELESRLDLQIRLRSIVTTVVLCAAALTATPAANAQTGGIGPSKGQIVGIFIAIAATGAAIGIVAYRSP